MSGPLRYAIEIESLIGLLRFIEFSRELLQSHTAIVVREDDIMPRRKTGYLVTLAEQNEAAEYWIARLGAIVHGGDVARILEGDDGE